MKYSVVSITKTNNYLVIFKNLIKFLIFYVSKGVSRHANLSYINDMSYEGRDYDFIDTFITLYGVIAQKNSNEDGFDYLPTYASPEEKHPAICVYCKLLNNF